MLGLFSVRGPFHRNSYSMLNAYWCSFILNHQMNTNFCTCNVFAWHVQRFVVIWKLQMVLHCDMIVKNGQYIYFGLVLGNTYKVANFTSKSSLNYSHMWHAFWCQPYYQSANVTEWIKDSVSHGTNSFNVCRRKWMKYLIWIFDSYDTLNTWKCI